jgi:hypothetical protein
MTRRVLGISVAIRESYGFEPGGLGVSLPKRANFGMWGEIAKRQQQ